MVKLQKRPSGRAVRAIFDRVLDTYSQDGYYYEGFEY
jgi:hypothetical protein